MREWDAAEQVKSVRADWSAIHRQVDEAVIAAYTEVSMDSDDAEALLAATDPRRPDGA